MEFERVMQKMDASAREMMGHQVMDSGRIDCGGYFDPNLEFASPSHVGNANYVKKLAICYFSPISCFCLSKDVLERLLLAIEFQKRCQRESGFIDIPNTNFDSPPDTAFALSLFACVARLARKNASLSGATAIWESCKPYLVSSALAVAGGGFHTPNHRWGAAAALGEVQQLLDGQVDLTGAISAYLAEGIDMNADGFYSEKSTAGYNATCNRALLDIADSCNRPDLLDYVVKNMECMIDLLHHDWTIVSSISRRQDQGKTIVPVNSVDSFYQIARRTGNERICAAAKAFFDRGGDANSHLAFLFLKNEEWQQTDLPQGKISTRYTRLMADTGVWRVREDRLSATVTTGSSNMFSLKYGASNIRAVRAHLPYFAGARFIVRKLSVAGETAELTLTSDFLLPQLPGYWLPLNRPVPFEDLPYEKLQERTTIPRDPFTIKAWIARRGNAFDFHIKTLGGMKQVPFLLEILLDPNVWVETELLAFQARADQTMILKEEGAMFRIGRDAITIKGGFFGHRNLNPSDSESTAGAFRVAMTDWSDVDVSFSIETGVYNPVEGECYSKKGPASIRAKTTL